MPDDVTIHETSIVQSDQIGAGTRIWAFCNVQKHARIGADCNICDHCFIENNVVVGDRVTIKNGVSLFDGIVVENDVFIGPHAVFTNDIYPRSKARKDQYDRILIRNGATIGAGAVIIAGSTIGEYAFVGAGAVVTKDIPDYTLWYGNPAAFVDYVCKCTKRLEIETATSSESEIQCRGCGLTYRLVNNKLTCTG